MDPVFLAGTKSGNVGRATLDSNNVDCVDNEEDDEDDNDDDVDDDDDDDVDDNDDCCLLYPDREEGCKSDHNEKNDVLNEWRI